MLFMGGVNAKKSGGLSRDLNDDYEDEYEYNDNYENEGVQRAAWQELQRTFK